jgi:GNAT superfamily N-acetyltransferase
VSRTPPAPVTIELLADRPDLFTAVAHLRWREWGDEPGRQDLQWWVDTTVNESGRDTPPVTFVAVDSVDQAAGGVGLAPFDPPERTDRGPWVVGTVVRADRRGEGVGRALMNHLRQWATTAGITQLWVATGRPAIDFYRACGFAITEVLDRGNGEPTTILAARLTHPPTTDTTDG